MERKHAGNKQTKPSANATLHCQQCGAPVSVTWHVPGACKQCGAPFEPRPRALVSVAFLCGVAVAVAVVVLLRMVFNVAPVLFFASATAAVCVFTLVEVLMFKLGALRLGNLNDTQSASPVALKPTDPHMMQQAQDIARSTTHAGSSKRARAAQRQQLREAVALAESYVGGEAAKPQTKPRPKATTAQKLPRCRFRRIPATSEAALRAASSLATRVAREHFDPILGAEQNASLIQRLYTPEAIAASIAEGYESFFVLPPEDPNGEAKTRVRPMGLIAAQARDAGELHLSEFCLREEERGKGYARTMARFVTQRARKLGCDQWRIGVDRSNYLAILAFEHLGFVQLGENDASELVYDLEV